MAKSIVDIVKLDNILKVENCSTRLRLTLKNNKEGIEDKELKALGIYGLKRLGDQGLQLIIGTDVEHVANEIQSLFLAKSE
ncbi:PTS transporter subunit EIIB [Spiroplasma floricola]|uniref:PTS transporter subunit EIIB n=1 Tax=Spiroplasma floricola TaxID=216937 RepID=UPI000C2D0B42|nr:PTS transporter subunit EIIB [Spiroplasma floricola]